jgi:hypothetical protein
MNFWGKLHEEYVTYYLTVTEVFVIPKESVISKYSQDFLFSTVSDRPWGQPNLLSSKCWRLFPRG